MNPATTAPVSTTWMRLFGEVLETMDLSQKGELYDRSSPLP